MLKKFPDKLEKNVNKKMWWLDLQRLSILIKLIFVSVVLILIKKMFQMLKCLTCLFAFHPQNVEKVATY